MEWSTKAFIRASLVWFMLGIGLGLAMAVRPQWVVYRPAHAHINVVGFLTMLVFGVGYQLLPRLFGGSLWSRNLAVAHWWLANAGLALMIMGFIVAPQSYSSSVPVLAIGGALYTLGAVLFVVNLWRTFDAADARRRAAGIRPGLPQLPTKLDD